jgi:leucyl-tRNA synthetase
MTTSNYNHQKIEKFWLDKWEQQPDLYRAQNNSNKPKYYCLVEFPYPSGEGLHVGHPRSNTALDIIARKKRMQGFNVLYPMGWDAFGLPSENYAIKTGIHPAIITEKNINNFRQQLKALGFSFDWSREVNTSDPKYYKWTQWIFLQFYKAGLAYKSEVQINWCLSCKIGLANEEVVNGKCERCGGEVEKRLKSQWMLKITAYADKLLAGLDQVDYIERAKIQQREWIGKSLGANINFKVQAETGEALGEISVFTTRPDTIYGVTYVVIAPEHKLINDWSEKITNFSAVKEYQTQTSKISDIERGNLGRQKTGIKIEGLQLIHPLTGEKISLWMADYVLANYGTGIVMAVPAHDERDWEFAKKFGLEIKTVIAGGEEGKCFTDNGVNINSQELNNLETDKAIVEAVNLIEQKQVGSKAIVYKLRDWVFSRQRYWGEPIPMINCVSCGWVPVPENQLPVVLPNVEKYQPTDNGESPLAVMTDWVNTTCPNCSGPAKRETDTMPNWAGSSWYFLRYLDPNNDNEFASQEVLKYWLPVDWYNGGMEHTTLHLLYSRFWHQFLFDQGLVPTSEPYQKRTSHGMILGDGGEKMSKSRGNVVNPDEVVADVGADTFRVYEMFMGPFDQSIPWDTKNVLGVRRFLEKVYKFFQEKKSAWSETADEQLNRQLHKTIAKVTDDIEQLKLNTAVSSFMICLNEFLSNKNGVTKQMMTTYIQLLAPFAPFITEEMWLELGNSESIHKSSWPIFDPALIQDEKINFIVQINGKLRAVLEVDVNANQETIETLARDNELVKKFLASQGEIKKIIFVPNKLINFVV